VTACAVFSHPAYIHALPTPHPHVISTVRKAEAIAIMLETKIRPKGTEKH
jgi:hypothetical protein